MASWYRRDRTKTDFVTRPAYKSDFNYTNYTTRAQVRVALGLLAIRELPIKNFYVRCWITYIYLVYFVVRGLGRGLWKSRPIVTYMHGFNAKALVNYPDFFSWTLCRILPKNPPTPDAGLEWRKRQTPVFHQYHKTVYRYRYRKPRYIPWDGSQNQPVMPYLVDTGSEVINGTFKQNCNTTPQLK